MKGSAPATRTLTKQLTPRQGSVPLVVGVSLSAWRRAASALRAAPASSGAWAGAIALAGSIVAAYVARFLLDGIPHVQDSVTYLFQAKVLAGGRLFAAAPPMPEFFSQEFLLVHDGKWFGKYPPGHSIMLALGVLAGNPWLVDPLLGGLTLFLVYALGRNLYSSATGLLAAFLGLTSPFFVFMSGSFMAHPSGLFFTTLFLLCLARGERLGTAKRAAAQRVQTERTSVVRWPGAAGWMWHLGAGAALGMLFLVRPYTALAVASPVIVVAGIRAVHRPQDVALRLGVVMVAFAPFALALLAYNRVLTGNSFLNPYELWWPWDQPGFGFGHGPDGGHTLQKAAENTWRNLSASDAHLYGWPPALTFVVPALVFVLGKPRRWDVLLAAVFGCILFFYALYWADGIMYGPRYYYEGLACVLVLTSRGALAAGEKLAAMSGGQLGSWLRARPPGWVAMGLVSLLVLWNLVLYMPGQWRLYHGYNYVSGASLAAVARAGVHDALVFVDGEPAWQWWKYGAAFSANSPDLESDVVYARDLGPRKDRELAAHFPGRRLFLLKGDQVVPMPLTAGG